MSDSAGKLARSRLAIIEHIQRKDRRHEGGEREQAEESGSGAWAEEEEPAPRGSGWFGRIKYATRTWWRHHPAHLAVELATPVLSAYARRKPLQFLGIAAALGAVVVLARPWKLISATGLLVALLKSSQLSSVVMSAMSAADFQKDSNRQR